MNTTSLLTNMRIMYTFMQRDIYVYRTKIVPNLINFGFILPTLYAYTFGYLQPKILTATGDPYLSSLFFIGTILVPLLEVSFRVTIPFVADLQGQRYVDYQLTLLPPRLLLLQRLFFASLFTILVIAPFYPVATFLLGDLFITHATSWLAVYWILYLSGLMISAYHILACSIIDSVYGAERLWMRFSLPLMLLGGFIVPWYQMGTALPLLGYITALNPFIYVTEGLRQAFLNKESLCSLSTCTGMLLMYTILFMTLACRTFKQRVDHI